MNLLVTEQELQQYGITPEELLAKFETQLLKDFEMCGVNLYLKPFTELSYDAIHRNLLEALREIPAGTVQQLLYRIDIPEEKLKREMDQHAHMEKNEVVADLIIKRILQKVILKLVYSSK